MTLRPVAERLTVELSLPVLTTEVCHPLSFRMRFEQSNRMCNRFGCIVRNILFLVLCNIPLKCSLKIFQGSNDMGITVFECPSWNSGQLTVDKRVLLDVINEVKTEKTYQEGRIIILSRYCT